MLPNKRYSVLGDSAPVFADVHYFLINRWNTDLRCRKLEQKIYVYSHLVEAEADTVAVAVVEAVAGPCEVVVLSADELYTSKLIHH